MEPQSNSLYSERAERFFIGAVLNSPNAARMMPALNAGDFAVSSCRKLFNAMAALFNPVSYTHLWVSRRRKGPSNRKASTSA